MVMVLAHIVIVEERLAVLKGRNHDGARRRDLEQARRQSGKQTVDAVGLVDVPDELTRVALRPDVRGGVWIQESFAKLDLFVRLDDVKRCGEKCGNLQRN